MTSFVDTNILLYAINLDGKSFNKNATAMNILAIERCALSFQVFNEFVWQATQARHPGRLSIREAMRFVKTLQRYPVQPIDAAIFDTAWTVSQSTNYGWWDSLIVAAAITSGCDTLLTEDMQHGRVIDGVRIVNPFRELA